MDPITHGVIGLAISAFSGEPVSLMNPVSIGAALGAMSPDLDSVTRLFFNDKVYLEHHRGKSHSIPFLAIFSIAITGILSFIFPDFNFLKVLMFTFLGALSHTLFDILNSYGAMLFRKKHKVSILMLYDPIISVLALFMIFYRNQNIYTYIGASILFASYISIRILMKKRAEKNILKHFKDSYEVEKVCVMPSLMIFHKWDFIINSKSHNIVGQYNLLKNTQVIRNEFERNENAREIALATSLGDYFSKFSPNFHVMKVNDDNKNTLRIIDLRYFIKGDFMHNGLVELDHENKVMETYFMPYTMNRKILMNEQ
ncbi:MAG: metal-dependent hydrolase [Clostridiales bacterium]|nr:metal-dependent hydrolase [Clostridiales bacterium]